uniref:F-box protein 10 n=1 Tax=Amazona collaria TaxID=241587 RepID=A0A8B9G976_9PSIT
MHPGGVVLLILACLCLPDLRCCSLVCRGWYELLLSLDKTDGGSAWAALSTDTPTGLTSLVWSHSHGENTGAEFSSLQAALGTTSPYSHLVLLPGVHEEQSKVLLKVPVEVVMQGKLGDLALLASIDQHCPTACFCNVVFMLFFFSVLYKTSSGYVQFNSCNFESGQLQIHAPEMCQVKFRTFNQSSIYFHSMARCILGSCEFASGENVSIIVEGCPSCDCNQACKHLAMLAKPHAVSMWEPDPAGCPLAKWDDCGGITAGPMRTCEIVVGQLADSKGEESPALDSDCSDSDSNSNYIEDAQAAYKLPYQAHSLSHTIANVMESRLQSNRLRTLQRDLKLKSLQQELQQDKEAQSLANSLQHCWRTIYSQGQAKLEGSIFRDLTYRVHCMQSSKVIILRNDIHHCKVPGIFLRLSAEGLIADSHIHSHCEAGVDIRKEANPLVLCNKIHSGLHSGIVVIGNRKGIIHNNQIYGNKEAGIYIWYNGNPAAKYVI